jgi:putative transposase
MPRRNLTFEPGHYYHLYNRGNDRQNIFFQRDNYLHFLRLVRRHLLEHHLDIVAYCLMPNHYHLLVHCKGNVTQGMQSLALAYTKAINRRYNRVGSLFQGRFQAIKVDNEAYLHNLVQYIHLNPVKAQIVDNPEDWEFSSYREYAGLREGTLPDTEPIREFLRSEAAYKKFLAERQLPTLAAVRTLMLDE